MRADAGLGAKTADLCAVSQRGCRRQVGWMVALKRYEQVGDPDIPVALDRRAHSRQRQAEATRESIDRLLAEAPPSTEEAAERLAEILAVPTPPRQLMRWRLRLYCGHVVEWSAFIEYRTHQEAFTSR